MQLCPRMGRFCFCCVVSPAQENIWSLSCFCLSGYFQTKNDVCKLFYTQSKRWFCQNQQQVSKPSRFLRTQRLTQSPDSPSGSSKQGPPYLFSYLGCGNQHQGAVGQGACRWKSRGKFKYYDSFQLFGKGLENSHPFLCPSLLATGVVLTGEACEYCRPIDSCTVNQSLGELLKCKTVD